MPEALNDYYAKVDQLTVRIRDLGVLAMPIPDEIADPTTRQELRSFFVLGSVNCAEDRSMKISFFL